MWISNAEQSRNLDRQAAERGIGVETLMERAGQAVCDEIGAMLPFSGKVVFLCGKGNNGGDGFVAARLAKGGGFEVECLCTSPEEDLGDFARLQFLRCKEAAVPVTFASDASFEKALEDLRRSDLIVDALLGTGARGQVEGQILSAIKAAGASGTPILSVDIPSGIDCDTGKELGESIRADSTITFGLPKPFLFQNVGLEHAGDWKVDGIGFPTELLEQPTPMRLMDKEWTAQRVPVRSRGSHKGDSGRLLIVAGSDKMSGAAALAVRGALRGGAGLVSLASTPEVCRRVATQIPECLLIPLPSVDGAISTEGVDVVLEWMDKGNAAVFGPGLSQQDGVVEFLARVWKSWNLPAVIDADALNSAASGTVLPNSPAILTPHPGEMARLLSLKTDEVECDRFGAVAECAKRYAKVSILKGAYSLIASTENPTLVNPTGNSGMATGGMGDVLSGLIGALLAQSLEPIDAAALGVYLHGLASDICARRIGPIGYTASELADALPSARVTIVSSCDYDTFSPYLD